jgi:hypothetical protein
MRAYTNGSPGPASPAKPPTTTIITGQYAAKARFTRRQRARMAAGLSTGEVVIQLLTVKQAAAIMQVPVLDVTRVRRNGKRAGTGRSNAETLADHIARSSLAERLEAARVVGPAVVWDTMIEPVIAEERGVVS